MSGKVTILIGMPKIQNNPVINLQISHIIRISPAASGRIRRAQDLAGAVCAVQLKKGLAGISKERCRITFLSSKHPPQESILRRGIYLYLSLDASQSEKLSEIKPPLNLRAYMYLISLLTIIFSFDNLTE